MTASPWRFATRLTPCASAGSPNTSTVKMARVRRVTAAAIAPAAGISVASSMSTNRGRAPSYTKQLLEATKLKGVVTTSSPRPMPAATTARCRPAVPELTATAWRVPT
jgi:hypothetical protein